jgi:hypothetical protein
VCVCVCVCVCVRVCACVRACVCKRSILYTSYIIENFILLFYRAIFDLYRKNLSDLGG